MTGGSPQNRGVSPSAFILIGIGLLSGSIALEATLLAGVFSLGSDAYHALHVAMMATLAASQFGLYFYARGRAPGARLALLFGLGACATGIGDFVNGAISGVSPVSLKLTWALLLFGTGYLLYAFALWSHNNAVLRDDPAPFARWRYAFALPVLAVNVIAWKVHLADNLAAHDLLRYGSFIFNATIYVALPTLGLWFFRNSGWNAGGLFVLIGTVLIPYSDLILFSSWLRGGDPSVPSFELYAYNWIVYFAGQVLTSVFPALVIGHQLGVGSRADLES